MSKNPLVSVITTFFNTPAYFMRESIESVLAQSYDHWELWLVNDGSSGDSVDIARLYAERYPGKIHFIEHENRQNRGASASRNLGIRHATGEYIALLDADDLWFPQKLEEQVAIAALHPQAIMLYGNTEYWYSWTQKPEDRARDFMPNLGVEPDTLFFPPKLLPLYLRGRAAVPCPCSILVRRCIVEKIGGFSDAVPIVYDDQVFYAKLCLEGPVYVSGTCWDRYRQHPESSCAIAERTGEMRAIRLSFLRWLQDYITEHGIDDVAVIKALEEELRLYSDSGWLRWRGLARYIERRSNKLLQRLSVRTRTRPS